MTYVAWEDCIATPGVSVVTVAGEGEGRVAAPRTLWKPASLVEAFVRDYMPRTDKARGAPPPLARARGHTGAPAVAGAPGGEDGEGGPADGADAAPARQAPREQPSARAVAPEAAAGDRPAPACSTDAGAPGPGPRACTAPAASASRHVGLDLGCGSGRDLVYLAMHGWRMTGVDSDGGREGSSLDRCADLARRAYQCNV